MKKYNLTVCVMYDCEPIMYLFSQDYEKTKYIGRFDVYGTLKRLFPTMDFVLITGADNESYAEYECRPDKEVDDGTYLLAIWQESKEG